MLINFSANNFRSIRSLQELNLTKSAAKELEDNNVFTVKNNDTSYELLKSATLYGANASGKSNFILALKTMRDMVAHSSKGQVGEELPYEPFRLSKKSREQDSEFEVIFIVDKIKYQYGFSYNKTHITEEWLFAYPKKKAQKWFMRAWDPKNNEYVWDFGRSFTGEKQTWVNSTRSNSLFLSTAVQLNSSLLQPIFNWFIDTLQIANVHGWGIGFSASQCEDTTNKDRILNFLRNADASIDDINFKKEKFDISSLPDDLPSELKNIVVEKMEGEDIVDIKLMKRDLDGELIPFDVEDESDGTRRLFSFAGPWLDALENGKVLFVDELNSNLHPLLVRYLIKFFHSSKTNPNNAQLIFTTHETSILNQEVFRRDQVWFVEKDGSGISELYALSDFKPKKDRDDLEAHYLAGAYGALPFLVNEES